MMYLNIFVILLVSVASVQSDKRPIEWNTLKLKWGPDPLVSNNGSFNRQPRTVQQALQEQYEPLPNGLGNQCMGKTLGHRYWKGKDPGAIIIFDKQGTIAGLQMAFPRSSVTGNSYSFDTQKMLNKETINNIEMYTITAYFIDPARICTTGRTLSQLEHEGTGTGLFFQNGTNPIQDSIEVPLWEDNLGKTKWVKGTCFKTMGMHYWYDNRLDMNCSEYVPAFIMYNRGYLSAFGWNIMSKLEGSKYIEFPPKQAIFSILVPVPTCMPGRYDDVGGFTTMHIYLNSDPANLEC